MKDTKLSGPAIFMYSTIVLMTVLSTAMFVLYYGNFTDNGIILWIGIVSFMILYHFGIRILMGEISKLWHISYKHPWFRPRRFEKKLYGFLRVREWRDKVLTFNPDEFLMAKRTLPEIADTMAKAEIDHWINEIISVTAIFFCLLWGMFPIFLITSIAAMLFDAQFILVQRFNRPKIVRLIEAKEKKQQKQTAKTF
ncbi:MAG: hypothetical protein E7583_00015 [Ruminococcaceae bacterium]|nr:hypothetical protein [Oscillospiraceae bacterium]